jgi:hypothetical protein
MILALVQNPVAVLATSLISYTLAINIAMAAYYKSMNEPFKSMKRSRYAHLVPLCIPHNDRILDLYTASKFDLSYYVVYD